MNNNLYVLLKQEILIIKRKHSNHFCNFAPQKLSNKYNSIKWQTLHSQ